MIKICKFCEKEITVPVLFHNGVVCDGCKHYSMIFMSNGFIESEVLREGNYYLCFLPGHGEASVVETRDGSKRIINTIKMDELTHEQAVHWVNKLKTYVLFQ